MLKQKALEDYYFMMDLASRSKCVETEHMIRQTAAKHIVDWHICEDEIRTGIATVNPTGQAGVGWAICKP